MIQSPSKLPAQRVAKSSKSEKWRKDSVEAIIGMCQFGANNRFRTDLWKAYEYYAGTIDEGDYSYVLKPYGQVRKNFPAKIQNYNIIKPVIDLLLGEKAKRPFNYVVTVANPDVITIKEEKKKKLLLENVKAHFLNELQAMGVFEEGYGGPQPKLPEEEADLFERSYKDERAIVGQNALTFLAQYLEIPRKFRKGFQHFLISGMVVDHHDVVGDEPAYEMLNPLEVDYDKSPNVEFIEDSQWAAFRNMMTPSQVIDKYWKDLTPEQISQIENPDGKEGSFNVPPLFIDDRSSSSSPFSDTTSRLIEVVQVYWKSLSRYGIVEYTDEMGVPQTKEVDDGYKGEEGEKIKWYWINEVWRGTRIDGDIFTRIEPLEVQRRSIDNPSICKLPINGRSYSDMNSEPISLVKLGVPYQLMYNIFKYRLEVAVAKAKDMVAQFDIAGIPKQFDLDDFLYYVDAFGIAWQDSAAEGYQPPSTHKSVIDLTAKSIRDYIDLLAMVQEEWNALAGVTRQRMGETSPYELKGTTQQSIIQSSHITEDIFMKYEEFEQRSLQGILDGSKVAWINGKKAECILPDWAQLHFEIDGITHSETEYGVFVTASGVERDRIENLRSLTPQMVQAGYPVSAIAKVLKGENFAQIEAAFVKAERSMKEAEEAQRAHEAEMTQLQNEALREARDWESNEKQKDRDNKIDVANIAHAPESPTTTESPTDDAAKLMLQERIHKDKMALEREELNLDRQKMRQDAEFKTKELAIRRVQAARKPSSS